MRLSGKPLTGIGLHQRNHSVARAQKPTYRDVDDLEEEVAAQRAEIDMLRRKLRDRSNVKRY